MPTESPTPTHEDILQKIAKEIDVPPEINEAVVARYQSLGSWLDRPNSTLKGYDPYVAPQGSFLIGTANRPITDTDEIDVDLICRLNSSKGHQTQKQLKMAIGQEVMSYAQAHSMKHTPENKRRCWTLKYADQRNFHTDILPCISDVNTYRSRLSANGYMKLAINDRITQEAIAITDKTDPGYDVITLNWPSSNPLGFAVWFMQEMEDVLRYEKLELFKRGSPYAKVEDIPDHAVKTTLQKAIQILKRHRDLMFADDPEHKPISIIITTLAAHAYQGELTLVDSLTAILNGMDRFVEVVDGKRWIRNPVNPEENFADKWQEMPEKERNFYSWLDNARRDFGTYIRVNRPTDIPTGMANRLGAKVMDRVKENFPISKSETPAVAAAPALITQTSQMVERVKDRGTETAPWCDKG
ncbi:MAG: nucleotidyltransferase [Rhizobiales bacterium]|nr:nucleotidyltransferase [Hyphomicrobiales bacterium]